MVNRGNSSSDGQLFDLIKGRQWDKFIKYLHDNKFIDVNVRDNNDKYLIQYAVEQGSLEAVKMLIKRDARLDIRVTKHQGSILYIPIKQRNYSMLKLLLEENKTSMGVSVLDIRDITGNSALHYSIHQGKNHLVATQLIMKYGGDVNAVDTNGLSAIHIAVISGVLDILKLVLNHIYVDIDQVTDLGESALHLAVNNSSVSIVETLLGAGIDTRLIDNKHGFSALHYAVGISSPTDTPKIVHLLLKYGADPSLQDRYGNTPLHHSIIEGKYLVTGQLIHSKYSKTKINYNLHNIEDKLPIHLLLLEGSNVKLELLIPFIKNSNLNHQDQKGDTPLHYLTKGGLWSIKQVSEALSTKKMNIFLSNKKGVRPVDYVKAKLEKFVNLVTTSYLYILRNTGFVWKERWQNMCGEQLYAGKLSKKEEAEIQSHLDGGINGDKTGDLCQQIVQQRIWKMVNNVKYKDGKDGDRPKCGYTSYPQRKDKRCVSVKSKYIVDSCTFTGSSMDILFGLIYLLKSHSNACSTLDKEFVENSELCDYYRERAGGVSDGSNGFQCQFINFEVVWSYFKLFLSANFVQNFKKCTSKPRKRFTVIPLGIDLPNASHANYLIYDKKTNEVERFEPYGSGIPADFNYKPDTLDLKLKEQFLEIDSGIKYIEPKKYMPKIGFQHFDVVEGSSSSRLGDPGGFCALWALWYTDQRLTYPDVDRGYLIGQLLKSIKLQNLSFKNLIRDYSKGVVQIRDGVLNSAGVTINDWVNEQYTEDQHNQVIRNIVNIVNKHS